MGVRGSPRLSSSGNSAKCQYSRFFNVLNLNLSLQSLQAALCVPCASSRWSSQYLTFSPSGEYNCNVTISWSLMFFVCLLSTLASYQCECMNAPSPDKTRRVCSFPLFTSYWLNILHSVLPHLALTVLLVAAKVWAAILSARKIDGPRISLDSKAHELNRAWFLACHYKPTKFEAV